MKPPSAIVATTAKRPQCLALSAPSTGSIASLTTSQKRKIRMPVAVAVKKAFTCGESPCIRPIGRPRKMVTPAIAPRRYVWLVDTSCKGHLTDRWQYSEPAYGTGPLRRRVPRDDLLPRLPDRRIPAAVDRIPHARLTRCRDARCLPRLCRRDAEAARGRGPDRARRAEGSDPHKERPRPGGEGRPQAPDHRTAAHR